ncbi:hypothetical protein [Sulfitobacter sp.]|uniref:hypothetical protein n=1 Tax=Sulfitobacter sp. TaxID=1903071 RepID=UPI004058F56E
MPAPIFSLATTGANPKATTQQILEAEVNRVVGITFDQANPEDRVAAAASAATATEQAGIATADATQAGVYRDQAQVAALAAGAPLVTILTDPVPANGTVELLQSGSGAQVWQVVTGAWSLVGWLTTPNFATIAAMTLATALLDGQTVEVNNGFNGETETFEYDASSALVANGALVVDATGMGTGRLISKRTVYANYGEFSADPRAVDSSISLTISYGNAVIVNGEVLTGPLFDKRTTAALTEIAKYPDGTVAQCDGYLYVSDSTATGAASVGVDGVAPYGFAVMQHFGGQPKVGIDNAAAFAAALAWIKQGQTVLTFTRGVWEYGSFTNYIGPNSGITFEEGASLLYTGTGTALSFDAFAGGGATDPFINNFDIHNLTLVGPNATVLVRGQGVARSHWSGRVNGTSGASGTIGWDLYSFNLSRAELRCSYVDGAVPYRGITLKAGTRAGTSMGACSNNVFLNTYPEGNSIGLQLAANGADQNKFVGGAPEACSVYGMLVGTECRYNSFEGMGFENLGATSGDVTDSGTYSRYLNCYSSEKIIIQGKGCKIDGGFFERVQIDASAVGTTVDDITVNNWATGAGGFFNNGTGTRQRKVYDADLGAYIYKPKARYAVTTPASGAKWKNDQRVPVKVRIIGGTVSQILIYQGTDSWIEPNPQASSGGTVGVYLLMPEQEILISYSAAPTMNVITQEAF